MASRKRKPNAKKDGDEKHIRQAKSKDETPVKRTPAPRSVKAKRNDYESLVTSEDGGNEIAVKPKKSTDITRTKRAPALPSTKAKQIDCGSPVTSEDGGTPVKEATTNYANCTKRTPASRSAKAKRNHYESLTISEDDEERVKEASIMDETHIRRATATRSAKRNRNDYEPLITSEDEVTPIKRAKIMSDGPTKRVPASRSAKSKRNDPEWLVTNEKSPLAIEGVLHSELCNPKTFEGFTKEDWEDLRSCLPDEVPLNPDGYSIPIDFFRLNIDFRLGVREFQEDLAAGRCDPKWQVAAAEAMEERARGDFDDFKEKNYEEFWGQKQKLDRTLLAGESSTLKLEVMIENGVFRIGDEIVFARVVGQKKENQVFLEKECKIESIGRKTMTIAIPPGRLKFFRQSITPSASTKTETVMQGSETDGVEARITIPEYLQAVAESEKDCDPPIIDGPKGVTILGSSESGQDAGPTESEPNGKPSISDSNSSGRSLPSSQSVSPPDPVILLEISNLKQLMDKIIEVDGRLNPKDPKEAPAVSPWKLMRARRNNQDLGSLFEMRDEFYVHKLPYIGKKSKK